MLFLYHIYTCKIYILLLKVYFFVVVAFAQMKNLKSWSLKCEMWWSSLENSVWISLDPEEVEALSLFSCRKQPEAAASQPSMKARITTQASGSRVFSIQVDGTKDIIDGSPANISTLSSWDMWQSWFMTKLLLWADVSLPLDAALPQLWVKSWKTGTRTDVGPVKRFRSVLAP